MSERRSACKVTPEQIIELFKQPDYSPMTSKEISATLELRGKGRKKIGQVLRRMILDGRIVMIRKNRFALGEQTDLITGRLDIGRSGAGFVAVEEGLPDVRIPKEGLGTALPGDTVTVRLEAEARPGARRTGKVIRIVNRGKKVIVGTLRSTGRFHYVVPLDPAYDQDFYVADARGAAVGDRVVIQFMAWEHRHVNPEAEVVDVIGPAVNPSLDTLATIRHFGLRDAFPPEVMRGAEDAAGRMDEPGARRDLRDVFVLTIDPETARDFDDALSLERRGDGQRVLGVHIADVGHFVDRDSELDREARSRGNSVYLPDKVLPMLPEPLSNGSCSLKPGQDRLTISVFISVDDSGRPVAQEFTRSVIRSRLRLTYEQAMRALRTREGMKCEEPAVGPEALALLRELSALAQQFRARRFAQYALDLDVPEYEIVIGKGGMISDVRTVQNDLSHQLIEECMVAANEAVDRHLTQRGLPILHRVHDPPAPEKITDLESELQRLGYRAGDLKHRRRLAEFLKSVKDDPLAYHIQTAVLRSMKRAVYSDQTRGHFGLAKKFYTHFTSPIRRYPDLVAHRVLASTLDLTPSPYERDELAALGTHCSWTEQTADEAERFLVEIKKYRFLEQQLRERRPQVYDAVVVNVRNFGMFVELIDLQVQGLVHVSAISDRIVRYDAARDILRDGAVAYGVGAKVKVYVVKVDFDQRRLDFALVRDSRRGKA